MSSVRRKHTLNWNFRKDENGIDRGERKNWVVDVMTTTSTAASEINWRKERKIWQRRLARRFSKPAGIFLQGALRSLLPFFPSRWDFPRRLITLRCSSHKTLFNLNQRERVYYTCWCRSTIDAFLFCFSLYPFFLLFLGFMKVAKWNSMGVSFNFVRRWLTLLDICDIEVRSVIISISF